MAKFTKKFRAYLKARGADPMDCMAPLVGIQELRDVVAWADRTPEYQHDGMTPTELIARYRKLVREGTEG